MEKLSNYKYSECRETVDDIKNQTNIESEQSFYQNTSHKSTTRPREDSNYTLLSNEDSLRLNELYNGPKEVIKPIKVRFSRRQWITFVIFGFANVLATTTVSLQAPFYPQEAEKKGATATEYGLVFGVFQLTVFITSPIFGILMGSVIPPKMMFYLGIFVTASCAILFAFLDYIQDRTLFIVLSFLVRMVQACGNAAEVTAAFTIIALEFPDSVATTFSALETCSGIGFIFGPTVGGALYEAGGFILPFVSMGGLLFLMGIITYLYLPGTEEDCSGAAKKGGGFFKLIRIPTVAVSSFAIAITTSGIGFLSATLEPHVRANFKLSPLFTGLIFVVVGATYAISAPLWGRICDKISQPKVITLLGSFLCISGFTLIGPAPFMPFDPYLGVTCLGLGIFGLGIGACLVSGYIQILRDALAHGFPNNITTFGLTSGFWTSSFALGSFIGPTVGGILIDNWGFRRGTLFVLATQAVVACLVLIFLFIWWRQRDNSANKGTLLHFTDNILGEALLSEKLLSKVNASSKNYGSST